MTMEMIKFEMEVLNEYTYGQLMVTTQQLKKVETLLTLMKEEAREKGLILEAVEIKKKLIRVEENLDSIGVAMLSKESDCFDQRGKFELICLN
jgi:hypothetical protein